MNRDMLSRRLIKKGFEVVMAFDGQKGLEMASSENPDIILLDMSLPIMDGWEVARNLKADDELKSIPVIALTAHAMAGKAIPVIALTAHAMAGDREKTLEAGCDEYDTKPIEFKRLLGKINDMIGA
jgi:CheY-like chemotaxis protein